MPSSANDAFERLFGGMPSANLVRSSSAATSASKTVASSSTSSSASSSPSSPYDSLVAILGQKMGMSTIQAQRAVGLSAITGTSLLVMKAVMYVFGSFRGVDDELSTDSSSVLSIPKQTRSASYSIFSIMRRLLRRMLLDDSEYIARAPAIADETDGPLVTYKGSCHCESIQFTVMAPNVLKVRDGPGKIQFRNFRARSENFNIYAGAENLRTYYVANRDSGDKCAHAFCQRCGVHILYAPSKKTPYVNINVRCLPKDVDVKLLSKKDTISGGIPVPGQFDTVQSDQMSTVSGMTQPFQFQRTYGSNPPIPLQDRPTLNYPNTMPYQPPIKLKRPSDKIMRKQSDVSSMASSVMSPESALEIPIKEFHVPSTHRRRTTIGTMQTASITEADSSINDRSLLPPMSPARSGGASFGGQDYFSCESISLMDDGLSLSSAAKQGLGTISIRGKSRHSLAVGTLRENDMMAGNSHFYPPRHPTVTSPKARENMKHFMSKYKKQKGAASDK